MVSPKPYVLGLIFNEQIPLYISTTSYRIRNALSRVASCGTVEGEVMSKFTHLHVHSHYSLLDGLPKIPDLITRVKNLGQESVALTDHGVMYGTIEFYKEAKAQGIKPIIGVEAYLAPRKLTDKEHKIDNQHNHLILLARNLDGYKNLLQMVSISHTKGFYYKPRMDFELLTNYHSGLVALSGCLNGPLSQAIMVGDLNQAKKLAQQYAKIFGEDNFYLEIQAHPEIADQVKINKELAQLAKELGLQIIATNDAHYLTNDDVEAQDILICIQTGRKVMETERLDMRQIDCSLKSEPDMLKDLPNFPEAINNAGKLADQLTVEIELGNLHFPIFPTPHGETTEAYLRILAEEGLTKKYIAGVPEDVRDRMEYELNIIMKKGYAGYFLVVADFVNWARQHNIITTTRGSAAGSLVSYLLGVTTVNPLIYHLPFERFLNPHRPSPPDIDMDFADNRRDEVIAYVTAKYGADQVAQIVTFGTMMARAAVRDVGRALGYPYGQCDRVAKMIPFGHQGFPMTIDWALKENPDLNQLYTEDQEVKRLLDLAKKVEGCARHASVHAAGVVIAPSPLTDFIPLQLDVDGQHVITQYEMYSCESVGLVKMDFLGIRNLSIMGSAIEIIHKIKNIKIDIDQIPLNDNKTFKLLAQGNTMGVFQLASSGITKYLTELKPTTINDIMAMVALYRPGPINSIPEYIKRKHNPKLITYLDDRMKNILSTSYGVLTYQDDVLLIAIALAGYTWEETDKLRKAMGKKIPKEMARQKEKFVSGCIAGGMKEIKALTLWGLIEPFAAYGFNKSHAASYGIVSYQTAYLKANFPTEFMAALMTAESDDLEKISQAVNECSKMNITVLPPDINQSLANFTVIDENHIRFGLNAIKNLGDQVAQLIIQERKANGAYQSLENFLSRNRQHQVTKKSLEALIKAGALDSLNTERRQLLESIEALTKFSKQNIKSNDAQSNLFTGSKILSPASLKLANCPPTTKEEKLTWEKEILGLYVSEHPFKEFTLKLGSQIINARDIASYNAQELVMIGGLITSIKQVTTKKGDLMQFVNIEDLTGTQEVVIFPETLKNYRPILEVDKIIIASGRISHRNDETKVIVEKIAPLNSPEATDIATALKQLLNTSISKNNTLTSKIITLPAGTSRTAVGNIKQILLKFPGKQPISFKLSTPAGWRTVSTPYMVNDCVELNTEISNLLSDSMLDSTL